MKRTLGIYIGVLLLLIAAVTTWRMWPSSALETNELYLRCKDWPGVRVGFIKDFPISDTLSCDVTTIEALTDEGWKRMVEEFELHEMIDQWRIMDSIAMATGNSVGDVESRINFWLSERYRPEKWGSRLADAASDSNDCTFCSPVYRWMSVFHTENGDDMKTIVHYYVKRQRGGLPPELPKKTTDDTIKQQ